MQTTRTPYSISFMATVLLLLLFACHSTVANAAVALGATRVIYPANQKQVLLPVTNNDPASVYLIQSWIENAGDQKDTQFVITPPLFSMQGKKENTLRIINATIINPTPYFITVTNMKAGNSNLPNTMVPPKGEVSVDIPHAATGDISFQTINDYGALTPRIKATMQ
ncbi:fimbria/pilus periplasmic chaperone [Escherichia coli]|nr:fimbria/pilus periplasmic chaperone [Escherichia coli]EER2626228.1 fimbria/pilus periplasmic chaperone [Escherichia coli]